jgi:hypothetical protein
VHASCLRVQLPRHHDCHWTAASRAATMPKYHAARRARSSLKCKLRFYSRQGLHDRRILRPQAGRDSLHPDDLVGRLEATVAQGCEASKIEYVHN